MADRKITELPVAEATDLANTNSLVEVVNPARPDQADRNRQATLGLVRTTRNENVLRDIYVAQTLASATSYVLPAGVWYVWAESSGSAALFLEVQVDSQFRRIQTLENPATGAAGVLAISDGVAVRVFNAAASSKSFRARRFLL